MGQSQEKTRSWGGLGQFSALPPFNSAKRHPPNAVVRHFRIKVAQP
jgi:hypothetical protein